MRTIHFIALALAIIGALNWGLWGLFQVDLVAEIFGGADTTISRAVYTLVGIAGVIMLTVIPWLAREPENPAALSGGREPGARRG